MFSAYRTFLLLTFVMLSFSAFASVPKVTGYTLGIPGSPVFASSGAACAAAVSYQNGDGCPNKKPDGTCTTQYSLSGIEILGGGTRGQCNMSPGGAFGFTVGLTCPENSTLSAGVCTCNSGFSEDNGQCLASDKCSGLAAFCSGMSGSQKSYATYDGDSETACYQPPDDLFWHTPKFPGCNQGCMAKAGPSTGVTDSTGKTLYKGMGTLTGGLCTYGTPSEPQAPDAPPPAEKAEPVDKRCAGQTGVVNGKEVCIPASSATGVDWTGSTTNSDGTKTEGKTTTTCSNGVCESTTVTTNKDANGNTIGTTTKVDQVSQAEYCANPKNSGSMICAAVTAGPVPGKDNNQTGGDSGGTGNGDGDGCTISDCGNDSGGGPGKVGLPGTGAGEFGKLYEPKYPQGPVEVWKQSSSGIKNSGLGSLAMALMPKIADGGSAPQWIVDFNFAPLGDLGTHDISPPGWLWDVLKAITILTALIVARRLIFGG